MGKGVAEHQLRSDDQDLEGYSQQTLEHGSCAPSYFWSEALEQSRRAFVLEEVFHNGNAADLVLKVGILNTGLDDVQWGGNGDGGHSAGNGGDKILSPSSLRVVGYAKNVVLRHGRGTEELRQMWMRVRLRWIE